MSTLDNIARLLDTAGVGTYSPDDVLPADATPIELVSFGPDADTALCLTTYAGPEPDHVNGWEYPRLQVRVRASNPNVALDLDRAAYVALQGLSAALHDGTALQDCYALQSDPTPLGVDDNGRHEFTRNYQLSTDLAG